jgi:hypothetical protein
MNFRFFRILSCVSQIRSQAHDEVSKLNFLGLDWNLHRYVARSCGKNNQAFHQRQDVLRTMLRHGLILEEENCLKTALSYTIEVYLLVSVMKANTFY